MVNYIYEQIINNFPLRLLIDKDLELLEDDDNKIILYNNICYSNIRYPGEYKSTFNSYFNTECIFQSNLFQVIKLWDMYGGGIYNINNRQVSIMNSNMADIQSHIVNEIFKLGIIYKGRIDVLSIILSDNKINKGLYLSCNLCDFIEQDIVLKDNDIFENLGNSKFSYAIVYDNIEDQYYILISCSEIYCDLFRKYTSYIEEFNSIKIPMNVIK